MKRLLSLSLIMLCAAVILSACGGGGGTKSTRPDPDAWPKTIGGSGINNDTGRAVCMDSSGNVYVTGRFADTVDFGGGEVTSNGYNDVFIVKYDSSGSYQWVKTFGGTGTNYGYSACTDPDGNVYVTGHFTDTVDFGGGEVTSQGDYDVYIVKFDSGGTYQWVKTFGGTGTDYGYSVCTDSSGNIYAAGSFQGTVDFGGGEVTSNDDSFDVFVVKYDSDGTYKWAKTFGSTGIDYGSSVCMDSYGNVFVTGRFRYTVDFGGGSGVASNDDSFDVFVVKYDSDGAYKWVKTFGGTGADYGYSVCTDSSGNIYAAGSFQGTVDFGSGEVTSNGSSDVYIVKYASDGTYQWAKTFGGTNTDYVYSVCTDSSGNIYAAGAFQVTVDFGDGDMTSKGWGDVFIVKYESDGTYKWTKTFGSTEYDYGYSVCEGPSGYIYAAGQFSETVDFGGGDVTSKGEGDIFILKLTTADFEKGVTSFAIEGQTGSSIDGTKITVTVPFGTGKTALVPTIEYTGGSISPASGTAQDFTSPVKYTVTAADGTVRVYTVTVKTWVKTIGGTGGEDDSGYSVCTDSSGNVYIAGSFTGTVNFGGGEVTSNNGSSDVYIVKYDSGGTYQWAKTFGGTGYDDGYSVCTDSSGNVYVTGNFSGTVDFGGGNETSNGNYDVYIVKYNSDGTYQWAETFGGADAEYVYSVCTDPSGNVYVTGAFSGTVNFGGVNVTSQGGTDVFIVKYNSEGTYQWEKTFGDSGDDSGYSICTDPSGNLIVTGDFSGTVNFGGGDVTSNGSDAFIVKYDSEGAYKWEKTFGGADTDSGSSVCTDPAGNIYTTGVFSSTVDFGGGDVASNGDFDVYIAKYDSEGSYVWAKKLGGTDDDFGASVAADTSGNVYAAGDFSGTVDFGDGEVTSSGSFFDAFLLNVLNE